MKIALSMIVKNEARIIERCLDSVANIVDSISICDTGSSDNTKVLITNWCSKWCKDRIAGCNEHRTWKLFDKKFIDFAQARTCALQETIESFPDVTYILLIDADMKLNIESLATWRKEAISFVNDSYLVEQCCPSLVYSNIRLVRARAELNWRYVGKTHEVLISDVVSSPPIKLAHDLLYIEDIGDGGSKDDKFVRDERLLLEGLFEIDDTQTDPDTLKSRYLFYLAQTYFAQGRYAKALMYYALCAKEKDCWSEQIFYCYYMSGECCYLLAQHDEEYDKKILYYMCKAFTYSQMRAEPYFRILRYLNDQNLHKLANSLAETACRAADHQLSSSSDHLFQDQVVLKYQIRIESAVADYYQGKQNFKLLMTRLIHDLENDSDAPQHIRDSISANAAYM